jgi:hypothetical protein
MGRIRGLVKAADSYCLKPKRALSQAEAGGLKGDGAGGEGITHRRG